MHLFLQVMMAKISRQDILIDDLISGMKIGLPGNASKNDESKKIKVIVCGLHKSLQESKSRFEDIFRNTTLIGSIITFLVSFQNTTIEERVTLLEIQVVVIQDDIAGIEEDIIELDEDVTGLDQDVNYLFDEQVIQDERLLNLEQVIDTSLTPDFSSLIMILKVT